MWLFFRLGQGIDKKCSAPQAITPGRQAVQGTCMDAALQAGWQSCMCSWKLLFPKLCKSFLCIAKSRSQPQNFREVSNSQTEFDSPLHHMKVKEWQYK